LYLSASLSVLIFILSIFTYNRVAIELEMPHCIQIPFRYLDTFSIVNPNELKIILLANGAFHKAERLRIPDNIILFFIPPYSPELNRIEKIWWKLKRAFSEKLHKNP
jgi:transposase